VHNLILHRILFINIVPSLVMERLNQFLWWSPESTANIKCSGNCENLGTISLINQGGKLYNNKRNTQSIRLFHNYCGRHLNNVAWSMKKGNTLIVGSNLQEVCLAVLHCQSFKTERKGFCDCISTLFRPLVRLEAVIQLVM
jgi:hypothetical protein